MAAKVLLIVILVGLVAGLGLMFASRSEESYTDSPWYEKGIGFVAFDDKLPDYEKQPDLEAAIGGMKGNYPSYPAYGIYDSDRRHLVKGTPNRARATRTILKPEYVGFSANSIVNRNYYDDLYNHVGDRRPNPLFKYITKERRLDINPIKYAEPQYRFSAI